MRREQAGSAPSRRMQPRGQYATVMSSRTEVTPGAAHAASIASSCSAHDRTVPLMVTVPLSVEMWRRLPRLALLAFLAQAAHGAAEGDRAVVRGHRDRDVVHLGIPQELVADVRHQVVVPGHCVLLRRMIGRLDRRPPVPPRHRSRRGTAAERTKEEGRRSEHAEMTMTTGSTGRRPGAHPGDRTRVQPGDDASRPGREFATEHSTPGAAPARSRIHTIRNS